MKASAFDSVLLTVELLKRIPRRGKISAPELRQQLEDAGFPRELRSIQRQLEALCQHFDIECDKRSKPFGYTWNSAATGFHAPMLSEQESLLLLLAQQQLGNLLPAAVLNTLDGLFAQARNRLGPPMPGKPARDWLDKVRVVSTSQPLLPPKIADDVFRATTSALYANHWLAVDYTNANGRQLNARVMPLGLVQQGPRLLLACQFEGHDDQRSLALHRMQTAQDTGMPFARPAAFDLQKFDEDGQFGFGEGKLMKLKFKITHSSGQHILESPLASDQNVKKLRNEYIIAATVIDSQQLRWWLRGFGADLIIISPKKLRAEFS